MRTRPSTLLLVISVACLPAIVLGAQYDEGASSGIMVAIPVLALAAFLFRPGFWLLTATLFSIPMACVSWFPPHGWARETPRELWPCESRLWGIAFALWKYKAEHGSFPPAVITDKTGKPMHSWRVLILPYLYNRHYEDLYRRYDFNEPWDGPNNKALLADCPLDYRCRDAFPRQAATQTTTSYVAVVGTHAAWTGPESRIPSDDSFTGNGERTVILIEVPAEAGIAWTEPKDLSLDSLQAAKTWPVSPVVHRRDEDGHVFYYYDVIGPPCASVAVLDLTTGSLPAESLTAERLRSLLAVGGCSEEDRDFTRATNKGESHLKLKWFNCSACLVWSIAGLLLLRRAARARAQVHREIADGANRIPQ
jgi:hypothetical protein